MAEQQKTKSVYSKSSKIKQIHITTGDPNGIGLEVALKALKKLKPINNIQFILWRANNIIFKNNLHLPFKIHTIRSLKELKYLNSKILVDIASPLKPSEWPAKAARHCLLDKKNRALTTGPLSKIQMQKDGFTEKGHTELLKKLSKAEYVFMAFLGDFFNVVLLTGHIPLKKILLKENTLSACIKHSLAFAKNTFPKAQYKKPLGILGFNPHAGEEGLLGKEEFLFEKLLSKWKNKIKGPLVPDTAFLKDNWKKFSMYICLYHDQALIPFKMIHERKSFQLSLGLPFIRTSVSHGTAKDIFKKNKANPESMVRALKWAVKQLKK